MGGVPYQKHRAESNASRGHKLISAWRAHIANRAKKAACNIGSFSL